MKRFYVLTVLFLTMLLITISYNSFGEKSEEVILKIKGMGTACCIPKVEEALSKVEGVKRVSACFKRGMAKVEVESGRVTIAFTKKILGLPCYYAFANSR